MNTLVYLLYGAHREYQIELTYSVLSALHWAGDRCSDLRIALVTDEANRRTDLPVENIVFSPAEFAGWTRDGLYRHEAKIHVVIEALNLFKGKVALIDTDTYFLRDPRALFDRIAPGSSVMHAYEGTLGNDRLLSPILRTATCDSSAYPISAATRLFNSGVIGIDYTDRAIVDDILPMVGRLYSVYPAFNIEQFACSVVLDRRTSLADGADLIRHYFGHERGFIRARIAELFPEFTSEAFRGEGSEYRFAYLAYLSALSNAGRSPTLANIWALIAALVLRQNEFGIDEVEKDFALLEHPEACHWATADTRRAWSTFWGEFRQARDRGQSKTTATAWLV